MSAIMPTYSPLDIRADYGKGVHLYANDGERYLDFMSGIGVNALGHAHPHLVEELTLQAKEIWHTSNAIYNRKQEALARRLTELSFADRVFFTNSGGEAMECALKSARRYHYAHGHAERVRFITFEGGFHGRTLATLAAAGQDKYLEGFGPVVPGFDQVPFSDLEAVKAAITPETAGILFEPIQGESGIKPVPREILKEIRRLTTERGLLLILDEVQCGMGRTGKLFAHEWAGIEPDIMAIAKALGGGFPIGACLTTEAVGSEMTVGAHGSTFGGNPLAMAVSHAVLDEMTKPDFLTHVVKMGNMLHQQLASLIDRFPRIISDIRGTGLMMGLVCNQVQNGEFVAEALSQHLILIKAGDNVVRLLPPLIIEESHIREAMLALETVCKKLNKSL